MSFVESVTTCLLTKYVTFAGRAGRSEFWWFYLFFVLLTVVASLLGGLISPTYGTTLMYLVNIALALPFFGVGCRRLHDTGRSGWWVLLYLTGIGIIVLWFWWAQDTKAEGDQYEIEIV